MLRKTALLLTTPMSILFNPRSVHIELSSKCTLKCPRCPRTEYKQAQLNQEYTLDEFVKAFPAETISQMDRILFCGDVGDPIYCKDLINIVSYIKKTNAFCQVEIVTNGSYKDVGWWIDLGTVLTNIDIVTFSVDGWDQASNELYRVNCNFDSIIAGAKALRDSSDCLLNWSTIYFRFNEDYIEDIRAIARDLGFDSFNAVRSTKFDGPYSVNGPDTLKPVTVPHIQAQKGIFKRDTRVLNRSIAPVQFVKEKVHPWAMCLNAQKEIFVNIEGLVFPCPWFNNAYHSNDFVQKFKDSINVKTRPFLEILADPLWEELLTRFEVAPLDICRMKCMP